ncbi:MAG: polynucleotide adenylyltransferase PcnB [Gammaproteobacteria bacterium]|nr:polynucleotide adenylyltransferase PcnB [Gammaproteobacteria bacterium]
MTQAADHTDNIVPLLPQPRIYSRAEHSISRKFVSESALKVLYRLDKAGFQAFLVGGSVRDLLLGREPKDFDVATNALPEQVRELFRNCRLIGRRFRLAHVQFGREIIEVATFRGQHDGDSESAAVTDEGRILRDNVYGTLEEDVWRRDFTVNALYYNIADFSIVDHVGGVEDLRLGRLRLIGDPDKRYREDPVRMLRAVRFATKLGFGLDEATLKAIPRLRHLLEDIAPARLFDEMLKMFQGGVGHQTFELLRHHGLFHCLFPLTDAHLDGPDGEFAQRLVAAALRSTDRRVADDKPITPAFLLAALLWHIVEEEAEKLVASGVTAHDALALAGDTIISKQVARIAMPRRFSNVTREIWALQSRLEKPTPKRVQRALEHPRFRAAYDFLLLRAEAGDPVQEDADFWTAYLAAADADRPALLERLRATPDGTSGPGGNGKRRRRRRRRPSTPAPE